jgi:glycosyltransferase involved in cell wall biosynthesis
MATLPTISIALCTYNGAKHLPAQLASLVQQTHLPFEIVACDDCSTDGTPQILKDFAATSPFPVRLHFNETNLGSTKNFEKAIGLCTGEVIATCDQDDVWLPGKLERLAEVFTAEPDVGLAFSDAILVDDELRDTGHSLWNCYHFPPALQSKQHPSLDPNLLLRFNVVTGACMAFRRSLVPMFTPMAKEWIHDYWIAFIASVQSRVKLIIEPLILYRRHLAQQVGASPLTLLRQIRNATAFTEPFFLLRADAWQKMLGHLSKSPARSNEVPVTAGIQGKIDHSLASAKMRTVNRGRRIFMAVRELLRGRYHRYGLGVKSFLVDAFYP